MKEPQWKHHSNFEEQAVLHAVCLLVLRMSSVWMHHIHILYSTYIRTHGLFCSCFSIGAGIENCTIEEPGGWVLCGWVRCGCACTHVFVCLHASAFSFLSVCWVHCSCTTSSGVWCSAQGEPRVGLHAMVWWTFWQPGLCVWCVCDVLGQDTLCGRVKCDPTFSF